MGYCSIHGEYSRPEHWGCPECQAAQENAEAVNANIEERIKNRRTLRILGIGAVVLFLLWMGADKIRTVIRRNEFEQAIAHKQTFRAQELARKLGTRYATADGLRELNEYDAAKKQFQEEGGTYRDLIEKFGGEELAAAQALVNKAEESSDPETGSEFYEQAHKKILVVQARLTDLISVRQIVEKLSDGTPPVTAAYMQKYAPREWATAQQAIKEAEAADTPEAAVVAYRQAATSLSAAVEKSKVSAKLTITCNVPEFSVFENNQMLVVSNQQVSLPPFVEHTLEIRAPGYAKAILKVKADNPGETLGSRQVVLQKCPQAGRNWMAQLGGGVTMEFITIPSGSFQMGSGNGDDDERPVRRVTISKPFWMAKTEVTQRQYQQVTGVNPSFFKGVENPVEQVSWNDAVAFCRKLTALERQAGRLPEGYEYTLPTEAQWEYACRVGTSGDYAGSLNMMGWYRENSENRARMVGQKQPNVWGGLHDMHGNVYEWCSDWYGPYPAGNVTDPHGPASGSERVCRGGGWDDRESYCRSAYREKVSPDRTGNALGFRPVLVANTAEIQIAAGTLDGIYAKAPPVAVLGPNWKGMCTQSGYDPYPMLLQIDSQSGAEISGRIRWPTLGDTLTRFRGRVENGYISFTEYEAIRGNGAEVPAEYEAVIKGGVIEGTCRVKRLLSTATAGFRLEMYTESSLVNAPGQTQTRISSGSSGWQPAPSSWGSQNAPVAQPNKPSTRPSGRTAW